MLGPDLSPRRVGAFVVPGVVIAGSVPLPPGVKDETQKKQRCYLFPKFVTLTKHVSHAPEKNTYYAGYVRVIRDSPETDTRQTG